MEENALPTSPFVLSDKTYGVLSWFALVVLPAAASAYAGLALIWHWGMIAEVTGTTVVAETLIGAIVGISKKNYNTQVAKQAAVQAKYEAEQNDSDNPDGEYDGDLLLGITDPDQPATLMTALNKYPVEFANQEFVKLKVKNVNLADSTEAPSS